MFDGEKLMDATIGFNRTFMELKFKILRNVGRGATVLIVPLWNWNKNLFKAQDLKSEF